MEWNFAMTLHCALFGMDIQTLHIHIRYTHTSYQNLVHIACSEKG